MGKIDPPLLWRDQRIQWGIGLTSPWSSWGWGTIAGFALVIAHTKYVSSICQKLVLVGWQLGGSVVKTLFSFQLWPRLN